MSEAPHMLGPSGVPKSPLDLPRCVTFFTSHTAQSKREELITLRALVERISRTRAQAKAQLPWLKLAAFGGTRTAPKPDRPNSGGSLRHDANVLAISGIEADYDGESMTVERARTIIAQANLAAVIYTSPSHTAAAPRWRVLCPTTAELPPDRRELLVARLNGLFLGALAGESFTLSQSYYFGFVDGSEDHRVVTIEGRCIDEADDLDECAVFRPKKVQSLSTLAVPTRNLPRDWDGGTHYGRAGLERECNAIRSAADGSKHHALNKAAYSIGGLVAAGELDEHAALNQLRAAVADIRDRCADYDAALRTLSDAFEAGKAAPRQAPPREVRHTIRVEIVPPEPPPREEPPEYWSAEPVEDLPVPEPEKPEKPKQAPLWVDQDEWTPAAIPARPWVVPGYLMRGSVSILSGQGAGGKSSLVVRWSIALALGEAVGEFAPRGQMVTLNYNVEDDREEQLRRYSAALMAVDRTPRDLAGRVIRCGPHDVGTLFERDPATGRVYPTQAMQALEDLIIQSGASVVICDPLAELHNAEENDNTAMRAVVAAFRSLARRLNVAVLILHHDRKGASTPGDMDRMRGASAVSGAVRVALTLSTMSPEEAEKFGIQPDQRRRHFRLDGAKSNYAPTQDAEWWRLDGYEIDNGETVAACSPWTPPSTFSDLSLADCVAVLDAMHRGTPAGHAWAATKQAGDDWAGKLLTQRGKTDAQAGQILRAWAEAGTISVGPCEGPRRGHPRKAYIVNLDAVSEMRRGMRGADAE